MILSISTTHRPATDLGFLLHKNPQRVHSADTTFGRVHVFYPEASEERCTASLMIEVDPVGLVRSRQGPSGEGGILEQYVNDRPYAASSFLSSGIAEMFSTAMGGRSKERAELANTPILLEARLPAVPCKGGEVFLRSLFEPLGYEVVAEKLPLDEKFPEWGDSPYFDLTLRRTGLLRELLVHLYVLIPVLDNDKHYWVASDEIDKLLRRGKGWIESHPQKEEITRRYLRHQRTLTREALARMLEQEGDPDPDARQEANEAAEEAVERPLSLHEVRLNSVLAVLKGSNARRVLDLGCGEGKLLALLLKDKQFEEVVGMDVSLGTLERAERRLKLDRMPAMVAKRLKLIHGSLMYRDTRLEGFDGAAVVEVIEHLDPPRLAAFERVLFECAKPKVVALTTPNQEYNELFPTMPEGAMRHRDHRFEWTRAEFEAWAQRVAERFGYKARFLLVGPADPEKGAPTQMAVFERE
jgi:3' terminal RNA ribose 2'-O-methyltransferase Hen1